MEGSELPEFVVYHLETGRDDDTSNIADTSGNCSLMNALFMCCLISNRQELFVF